MSRTDTGPQRGLPMPMRGALGSTAPVEQTRNFGAVALRMLRRLRPQRAAVTAVLALSVAGIVISAIGPRILGHATDLLFDGVVGARLPAGIDKAQAVADARARGDDTFADMLASMNVVPGHGVDFAAVARTLTLALGLYLIAALLIWVQARLLNVILQRTLAALRADVAAKIHRMPLSAFDSRPRGELLSRVTNDVDNIATSVSMTVNQLLSSMLTLLAVLAMMLTISPMLTLIAVATVPLSLWATRAITRRSRKLFVAQWRNTGRLNAHIEETYTGFTVVRTYGHRDAARDRFAELNGDVYRAGRQAQFLSGLIGPATTFVGNISYVAVAVVGGIQVATGQLSLGGIQAFIQYVRQFNQPLSQVAGMYNTLQSGLASAERVFELLDEPEMGPEPAGRLPGSRGSAPQIRFEDLGFGYRPGRPVLQSVTLTAEPGTTVAIVGPTGAGKTTLVNLLMRFYEPDAGRICFDGTDIAGVHRSQLRSRMAMVLQDTWLFDGTIAENIAYGRPDDGSEPNEDDIREAARSAFVDGFVSALPHGYHTRVGDGGGLSAGERQLITIARAFMARPDVLILDEATSSVDTRTELVIQQAMAELRRDRTCFVIAHRLSTIRDADLIVVLEAGRIVEQGSHTELLARRGAYWAMVQASR